MTTTNRTDVKKMIILELIQRPSHQITLSDLRKRMWMHVECFNELSEIMMEFDASGIILILTDGPEVIFKMPKEIINEYKKLKMNGR